LADSEEISDRKAPGFWFYPADYERDMQLLPMAAQGLWMRMLCWMHDNEIHRGFLELPTGLPMTEQDIARRAGISVKETRRLLACMERIGTFSKDERGCLLSRRMARDTHISVVRRQAAIKRLSAVERAKHGEFAPANHPANGQQTPSVTASVTDSDSTKKEEPPKPPEAESACGSCSPAGERITDAQLSLISAPTNGTLKAHQGEWFEAWWAIYWRKVSRKPAEKAFQKHVRSPDRFAEVMSATRLQTPAMLERDPDHRPHGATWLNAERWTDSVSIPAAKPPGKLTVVERTEAMWAERIAKGESPL